MLVLQNILPNYIDASEIQNSEIFLEEKVVFEQAKKYLVKAESGRGKSSILNFIYGINNSYSGKILFNNINIDYTSFRKEICSYVFQDLKLFDKLTVLENINLKNNLTKHKNEKEIFFLLEKMGLSSKKNELLAKLSLGQKQRVAVLRALCQPFKILLLDEPFSHLDAKNISILSEIIQTELKYQKASLIMVSLGSNYNLNFDTIYEL